MQSIAGTRDFRQLAVFMCLLELVPQTVILAAVEIQVRLVQPLLFRTSDFPLDQVVEVRQLYRLVEPN